MIISLSACSLLPEFQTRLDMLTSETNNADKENLKTTQNVLDCFSKKDAKALKALLCPKTQELKDTDQQILEAFRLFHGKVISFNKDLSGNQTDDIEYGKRTSLERDWGTEDIVTDENNKYTIQIHTYNICDVDKSRVGITDITISSKGSNFQIGYRWPFYNNEGQDLSYKLITAFSDRDIKGIKSMLCAKTSEMADIDTQIQDGLGFFEGKAIMGAVKGNSALYDGDNDYDITVNDHEIVKNGKPTRTSLNVIIVNIKTDANKIYKMEFYANLLYTDDKAYKGITQINITDDGGKKKVIGMRFD